MPNPPNLTAVRAIVLQMTKLALMDVLRQGPENIRPTVMQRMPKADLVRAVMLGLSASDKCGMRWQRRCLVASPNGARFVANGTT